MDDIAQDLRFAARLLGKHRSFTSVAVIVLAFGIGVNGLFLTLVDMICLRGLPLDRQIASCMSPRVTLADATAECRTETSMISEPESGP